MSKNTPYNPPLLRKGDRVVISKDATWSQPVIGQVVKPGQRYTDVVAFIGQRLLMFNQCLYRDDPYVTERPHLLDDEDRAIFQLAPAEVAQREMEVELAEQRELLNQLAAQVATLSGNGKADPEPAPARRPPGRPPKKESEDR